MNEALLVSLLLSFAIGAWGQGTECPDHDGEYDVYYGTPSNFYDSTQHSSGEHLYINSGNATCLFLTGTPDPNGGYYCRSKVTASWGTGTYTELGNTLPTIVEGRVTSSSPLHL